MLLLDHHTTTIATVAPRCLLDFTSSDFDLAPEQKENIADLMRYSAGEYAGLTDVAFVGAEKPSKIYITVYIFKTPSSHSRMISKVACYPPCQLPIPYSIHAMKALCVSLIIHNPRLQIGLYITPT